MKKRAALGCCRIWPAKILSPAVCHNILHFHARKSAVLIATTSWRKPGEFPLACRERGSAGTSERYASRFKEIRCVSGRPSLWPYIYVIYTSRTRSICHSGRKQRVFGASAIKCGSCCPTDAARLTFNRDNEYCQANRNRNPGENVAEGHLPVRQSSLHRRRSNLSTEL